MEESQMQIYGQYTVPSSDKMVNLGVGQPRNAILSNPVSLMQKYLKEYSEEELPGEVLQYGDIPGYFRFRYCLSKFLNNYNYLSKPEHFFQTNGATEAVSLITTLFTSNDDILVVENPTYFLMINIFKELGRNVLGINMDNEGFLTNELENILDENKNKRVLFYGIPFNHNPTGVSWSDDRKMELCALLDEYENLTVMTDEVYQLLDFEKTYHIPMAEYHPNILSVGSFSKVIAPTFRIGWIYSKNEDYQKVLKSSASRDSSGGNNVISSLIVERMLVNGDVEKLLESEKERLRGNLSYIEDYMEEYTSKYFDYKLPKGGYFLWLTLKEKYNMYKNDLVENMEKFKVKFHMGHKFSITNDFDDTIRLSLSFYTKEEIMEGLVRLNNMMDYLTNKCVFNLVGVFGHKGRLGKLISEELEAEGIYKNGIDDLETSNLGNYDCIIDVTSKDGTLELIRMLLEIEHYPILVVGTTGHNDFKLFEEYGKYGSIYYLSNFSSGIRMLKDFIKSNSEIFGDYNVSIMETHHIHKKDSPSGTAISLAKCFEKNSVPIKSYREGEVFGEHTIVVSNKSEIIEITHKALNRELFSKGCVKFIKGNIKKHNGFKII